MKHIVPSFLNRFACLAVVLWISLAALPAEASYTHDELSSVSPGTALAPGVPRGAGAFRYYLSGDNHSVLGHGDANGTNLARFDYSAGGDFAGEGGVRFHDSDGDGDIDIVDFNTFLTCYGLTSPECLAIHDSDGDGIIGLGDFNTFLTCYNGPNVSPPPECLIDVSPPAGGSFVLHGRPLDVLPDGKTLLYVRARHYDPRHSRWLQRDPLAYVDGGNLYEAFGTNALANTDPYGAEIWAEAKRFETLHQGMPAWAVEYRLNRNGIDLGLGGLIYPGAVETEVVGVEFHPFTTNLRKIRNLDASIEGFRQTIEQSAILGADIAAYSSSIKLAAASPLIIASAGAAGQAFAAGGLTTAEGLFVLGVNAPQIAVGVGTGIAGTSTAVGLTGYAMTDVNPDFGPALESAGAAGLFGGTIVAGLGAEAGGLLAPPASRTTVQTTVTPRLSSGRLTGEQLLFPFAESAPAGIGAVPAAPIAPRFYSVAFEMRLAPSQFALRQQHHFQIANIALRTERAVNPELAKLVPPPTVWGRPPAGWTWQHATIRQGGGRAGVLHLVPAAQHVPGSPFWQLLHPLPGGAGGYWEWAVPAGAPPR